MNDFKAEKNKNTGDVFELRAWKPGDDMNGIHVSLGDKVAGSPKAGDMIARDPNNRSHQWLVAGAFFAEAFEPAGVAPTS